MGWRVIYIEESESLKLYLDNLKVVKNNQQEVVIPLSDIDSIIIDNPKLTVTIQLLNKCAEYNVNVVTCAINHMPTSIIMPIEGNRASALIQRKQLLWSVDQKDIIHQIIIKNKIRNQKRLLEYFRLSPLIINRLSTYEDETNRGDTTNREGLSAKSYFRELYGSSFKRFNEDPINFGLNYGYSILRSQISKTIIGKGLNPMFGIIHYGPENNFNLSDDIIEPFRTIIDAYCFKKLVDTKIYKLQNRLELIKATTIYLYYGSNKQTLFNVISMYIESIVHFFETGDISRIEDIKIPYEEI